MRFSVFPALAFVLLAAPAGAEEIASPPRVDLFASIFAGFTAGEVVAFGNQKTARVTQDAPGSFTATQDSDGTLVTLNVTEPEDCVFEAQVEISGRASGLRADARTIAAIAFTSATPDAEYVRYRVVVEAAADAFSRSRDGGPFETVKGDTTIGTSVPLETLEASAAALLAACRPD